jgi:hypothetical protein
MLAMHASTGRQSGTVAKLQCRGFQIEIKENKTPGGEKYLDPPGAELLAWLKISQAKREQFNRGPALR